MEKFSAYLNKAAAIFAMAMFVIGGGMALFVAIYGH